MILYIIFLRSIQSRTRGHIDGIVIESPVHSHAALTGAGTSGF